MRLNLITLIIISFLWGCAGSKVPTSNSDDYLGYQERPPVPIDKVIVFDKQNNSEKEVYWESMDDEMVRKLLPLQSASVSIKKTDISGGISYLGSGMSAEKGSYEVVMDYMKYRIENVYEDSNLIGSGHIGIGFRIRANVITTKAKLNIGSLGSLGVEAGLDHLRGSISVEVIGIDSENVTNLIPLTSEINQTSIQSALQGLAAIKSKLWERGTTITPHLLALQQTKPGKINDINNQILTSVTYSKTRSSVLILNYWKPAVINKENEQIIQNWLEQNNLPSDRGFIVTFIYGKEYDDLKDQMVRDLNLERTQTL